MSNKFQVIKGGKKTTDSVKQRKLLSVLRAVMFVLVILMILFVTSKILSDRRDINADAPIGDDGNYIYNIASASVLDMKACNGGLAVLTGNNTLYVSRSGASVTKNPHTYADPCMLVSGDEVLLFDRGGKSYRFENSNGVGTDLSVDTPIINACFGKKGYYALSVKGDDALSVISVYDKKHNMVFQWKCVSDYITAFDISPNGKNIIISVMGSKNAALYSKAYIFRMDEDKPRAEYNFDCAVFSVDYQTNKKASVIGDGLFCFLTDDEMTEVNKFTSDTGRGFAFDEDSGKTAVLLSKYGSEHLSELHVYNVKGNELMKQSFTDVISSIDCEGRYAAAAWDGNVEIFNTNNGKSVGKLILDSYVDRILLDGANIYVLSYGGISVYSATSHISVQNTPTESTTQTPENTSGDEVTESSHRSPIAALSEPGTTMPKAGADG